MSLMGRQRQFATVGCRRSASNLSQSAVVMREWPQSPSLFCSTTSGKVRFQGPAVNQLGNEKGHNCGSNESNFAAHIWDRLDANGHKGAMACVVVPWFADRDEQGVDWRALAWWIHDHLPYSTVRFFPRLCAFNIGWHERPARRISSCIDPKGLLFREAPEPGEHAALCAGFPAPRG